MKHDDPVYTNRDVYYLLSRRLGYPVPIGTYRRWKRTVGLRAESIQGRWLYTRADVEALALLARWFHSGRTLRGFLETYM